MNEKFYCIIMAGGVGSRFWPLSRDSHPKQFIDILGVGRTFLQMTVDRFAKAIPVENILIVTAERYAGLVREQVPEIPEENVLLEPVKRNTAPCIAYATYKLLKKCPDATVVVAPSDHLILGEEQFISTVCNVMSAAATNDRLYTIGIRPATPNTNYGYIQANREVSCQIDGHSAYGVKTFTEKPSLEMAKVFLETGEFYWNSGIFIWNLQTIRRELEKCLPVVARLFAEGKEYYYTENEPNFISRIYAESPAISIDYGVMEKTSKAWVYPAKFGWSDVGTWGSYYEQSSNKDKGGNVLNAKNTIVKNVKETIVHEKNNEKLVVLRDMERYLVVDTDDVLMVCPREDSAIKEILMDLAMQEKGKYL